MPDFLAQALAIPGISWVFAAAFVAGVVRGFTGFGTAMVFIPVAVQAVEPVLAVITMMVMDMFGPLPAIPRALRDGHRRDLGRMLVGAMVALPLGMAVLFALDPVVFRVCASGLSLGLLILLVAGIRYNGEMRPPLIVGTGALGGFMGGASGLAGPPVILLYMASKHPVQVIRGNITTYLLAVDALMMIGFAVTGRLTSGAIVLGLAAALPNLAGNLLGGWMFRPGYERVYRWAAYGIIATSALSGLWSVFGEGASHAG